ncbi:hypothetical protein J7J90_03930 [Candidatus Micrarchaeota archaeon]|nr:hypothetical protein [Candidatus Micrarchaeota archaeon]
MPYYGRQNKTVPKPVGEKGPGKMPMYDMPYGATNTIEMLKLAKGTLIFWNITSPNSLESVRKIAERHNLPFEIFTEGTDIVGFRMEINGTEYNISFTEPNPSEILDNFSLSLINLVFENKDVEDMRTLFYLPTGELNSLGIEIVQHLASHYSTDQPTAQGMIDNMLSQLEAGQWRRETFDPVFRPFFASSDYLTTENYNVNIQSKPYQIHQFHISGMLYKKMTTGRDFGVQAIETGLYIDKKNGVAYLVDKEDELPDEIKKALDDNPQDIDVYHYKPYFDLLWWQCVYSGRLRIYGDIVNASSKPSGEIQEQTSPYMVVNKVRTMFKTPPKTWYFGIQHVFTYGPSPWQPGKSYQLDMGGELGYAKYSEDKKWIVIGVHGGGSLYLNALTLSGSVTRHFTIGNTKGMMDSNVTSLGFSLGTKINNKSLNRVIGDTSIKIYETHNELITSIGAQLWSNYLVKGGVTYEHWKHGEKPAQGLGLKMSLTVSF